MARPIMVGLALALASLLFAFFPAGAGHGWGAPFFVSIPLLIVYPVVLARAHTGGRDRSVLDIAAVVIALTADAWLVQDALAYGEQRLPRPNETFAGVDSSVLPIFLLWLALWLYWQFVAVRTVSRRRDRHET